MRFISRLVGNLIFIVAFALSVKLAWDLHGDEIVPLGVASLALVMSAFGLLLARNSWADGARPEWLLGLFMWIVGATAFTITEWGFWFSSYTERHAEYQEIKTAESRAEGLKDQAWTALTTGQVPQTSAQIQADISAKKLDPIYTRTAQCTDATLPDSRAFCSEFFTLQSTLASVKKRESLEEQVQQTQVPEEQKLIHDVFAQAEWLSRLLGVSEETAGAIIILTAWLVLAVCRDTGMLVANPPKRPAPAIARAPTVPSEPVPAIEGEKKAVIGEPVLVAVDGKKPKKPTPSKALVPAYDGENIVDARKNFSGFRDDGSPLLTEMTLAHVRSWINSYVPDGVKEVKGTEARKNYLRYCKGKKTPPLHRNVLGKALTQLGVEGRRTATGVWYIFDRRGGGAVPAGKAVSL